MSDLVVARQGSLGRITLNRPKALNALTHAMVCELAAILAQWRNDDAIVAVLMDGAGERGLCAGGDIRSIYNAALQGRWDADQFWCDEYAVNAAIAYYPKPYIAFMDGIVMGGGVGIAAHGSHRIVTERTRLAMPEVAIGFVPDVGGTFLLSRAPGECGTFAALTAKQLTGADAIGCALADHYVSAAMLPALATALAECVNVDSVNEAIQRFAQSPPVGDLLQNRVLIDRCFGGNNVETILAALDEDGSVFAADTVRTIRKHSPTSLKVTLAALRRARALADLESCLVMEYRIATACIRRPDMIEGIRAAVVDKDRAPRWSPATLASVLQADVETFFKPPKAGDLEFPRMGA